MNDIISKHSDDFAPKDRQLPAVESPSNLDHELTQNSDTKNTRHVIMRWIEHDIPYFVMLILAFVGVVFRLPVVYWIVLIPVFAVISIASGWNHFKNRNERLSLVFRQALDWLALLLAIFLLFNNGVQGVLNANATSLTMMTLLALGTFVAGVQARVWQISAVGGALFLAVPGLGWLDQSPLLLTAATLTILICCGLAWWASHKWLTPVEPSRRA